MHSLLLPPIEKDLPMKMRMRVVTLRHFFLSEQIFTKTGFWNDILLPSWDFANQNFLHGTQPWWVPLKEDEKGCLCGRREKEKRLWRPTIALLPGGKFGPSTSLWGRELECCKQRNSFTTRKLAFTFSLCFRNIWTDKRLWAQTSPNLTNLGRFDLFWPLSGNFWVQCYGNH